LPFEAAQDTCEKTIERTEIDLGAVFCRIPLFLSTIYSFILTKAGKYEPLICCSKSGIFHCIRSMTSGLHPPTSLVNPQVLAHFALGVREKSSTCDLVGKKETVGNSFPAVAQPTPPN
jgi:hypothetical protein